MTDFSAASSSDSSFSAQLDALQIGLQSRWQSLQERVAAACYACGRDPASVQIVAVSKGHPPIMTLAAARLGIFDLGENYPQEMHEKQNWLSTQIPTGFPAWNDAAQKIRWHFIGRIQSNKLKFVVTAQTHMIHSVADFDHLRSIDAKSAQSAQIAKPLPILLQINIGKEPQKGGLPPDAQHIADVIQRMQTEKICKHIHIQGLMCIPPDVDEAEQARPYFSQMRKLRDDVEKHAGIPLPTLSMGMSDDFHVAIQEGATVIRVGTLLFGPRHTPVATPSEVLSV